MFRDDRPRRKPVSHNLRGGGSPVVWGQKSIIGKHSQAHNC